MSRDLTFREAPLEGSTVTGDLPFPPAPADFCRLDDVLSVGAFLGTELGTESGAGGDGDGFPKIGECSGLRSSHLAGGTAGSQSRWDGIAKSGTYSDRSLGQERVRVWTHVCHV